MHYEQAQKKASIVWKSISLHDAIDVDCIRTCECVCLYMKKIPEYFVVLKCIQCLFAGVDTNLGFPVLFFRSLKQRVQEKERMCFGSCEYDTVYGCFTQYPYWQRFLYLFVLLYLYFTNAFKVQQYLNVVWEMLCYIAPWMLCFFSYNNNHTTNLCVYMCVHFRFYLYFSIHTTYKYSWMGFCQNLGCVFYSTFILEYVRDFSPVFLYTTINISFQPFFCFW